MAHPTSSSAHDRWALGGEILFDFPMSRKESQCGGSRREGSRDLLEGRRGGLHGPLNVLGGVG
jgi:hypothetical protein